MFFYGRIGLNNMDDLSDTGIKHERIRLHKKKDNRDRTKEKMTKYYNDPEKQARLVERIKEYKDVIERYSLKIAELEQYVWKSNI